MLAATPTSTRATIERLLPTLTRNQPHVPIAAWTCRCPLQVGTVFLVLSTSINRSNMRHRRRTPSFLRPPVNEVALGVQFEEPLPLSVVHYGGIWEAFREGYPELKQQPPLNPVIETFGDEERPSAEEIVGAAFPRVPVRLWFENAEVGGLVQVQADRFVFNWRRLGPEGEYPRFSWVLARFEQEFDRFRSCLAACAIDAPKADICEVTYVNHLAAGEAWRSWADLHSLFPRLGIPSISTGDALVEEADIGISYLRLSTSIHPGTSNRHLASSWCQGWGDRG